VRTGSGVASRSAAPVKTEITAEGVYSRPIPENIIRSDAALRLPGVVPDVYRSALFCFPGACDLRAGRRASVASTVPTTCSGAAPGERAAHMSRIGLVGHGKAPQSALPMM